MKKVIAAVIAAVSVSAMASDTIRVERFRHAGPFPIGSPAVIDSLDVKSKRFDMKSVLDMQMNLKAAIASGTSTGAVLPKSAEPAVGVISFDITTKGYATPSLEIKGISDYKVYLNGAPSSVGTLKLKPATYTVAVKYLASDADTANISLIVPEGQSIIVGEQSKKMYTLDNVLHGRRINSTSVSPDGKYLITIYSNGLKGGKTAWEWVLTTYDGKPVSRSTEAIAWMPKGSRYYRTANTLAGRSILVTDASTGVESVFAEGIPTGGFVISPDEKYLVVTQVSKGPKEDEDVYRILEPEDRQPGWRKRTSLALYDLATGMMKPLTFGHHSVYLQDISDDATKLLVSTGRSRLSKRPTTVYTIAILDLKTMKLDTVVADDGFVSSAIFSPDATKVLVMGSPEAIGGIGKNVPEGRIPSMVDTQLFMYNVADRKFKPLTRDFDPNVTSAQWSRADGQIYFVAENRDCISAYRLNPDTGKIVQLPIRQDIIKRLSLPDEGVNAAFCSQSMDNPDRLYIFNTKTLRSTMLDEPLVGDLAEVEFGTVEPWSFVSSRGDSIHGRFYLPPGFDPAKKYPMIVNYYGGCSPTSRNFESRYPHHAYAAQGYVVYVVEPSGATGFGQEFSSRHVNTAGEGVAQDIIEGTKRFCEEHPYVDSSKIGCIGASYGGFMTQYLQTVTDIFAAAISHAGISDHTSYWGEGYWGYSYSEVSMADSYPWSETDLYVKQSPLYNADKIHTPILFLHGDSDNNVPVGESIQMFTALKLLDRPTAFVAVKDQDHHIMDYDKRIKWQDTIFAWFAKYLKNQPEWWDSMYPEVSL